jgi:hypothetical protein
MVLVVASTNGITLRIAAGLLIAALVVVLIIAKNVGLEFSIPEFSKPYLHLSTQLMPL